MKENYHKKMLELLKDIKSSGKTPKLLLHSCCAPCSSHVIDLLSPYFDITILYYNPNIEPYEEYEKRKKEEMRFIKEYPNINQLDILDCDYDNILFHEMSKGLEMVPEGGERCFKCYELRMRKTAKLAKDKKYDYFATTLTVSPLKNSQKLNEIGLMLEREVNIEGNTTYSSFSFDSSLHIFSPQKRRILTKFKKSCFNTGQFIVANIREAYKPRTYNIGLHFPKIKRIF